MDTRDPYRVKLEGLPGVCASIIDGSRRVRCLFLGPCRDIRKVWLQPGKGKSNFWAWGPTSALNNTNYLIRYFHRSNPGHSAGNIGTRYFRSTQLHSLGLWGSGSAAAPRHDICSQRRAGRCSLGARSIIEAVFLSLSLTSAHAPRGL